MSFSRARWLIYSMSSSSFSSMEIGQDVQIDYHTEECVWLLLKNMRNMNKHFISSILNINVYTSIVMNFIAHWSNFLEGILLESLFFQQCTKPSHDLNKYCSGMFVFQVRETQRKHQASVTFFQNAPSVCFFTYTFL